jgi:hypothetical protein
MKAMIRSVCVQPCHPGLDPGSMPRMKERYFNANMDCGSSPQ